MDHEGAPSCDVLLKFVDLQTHCGETADSGDQKWSKGSPAKKAKSKPSYTASMSNDGKSKCVVCKGDKHSLTGCAAFQGLLCLQRMDIVRENGVCLNCLKPGHFAKECWSLVRCRKCKQHHHMCFHGENLEDERRPKAANSSKERTDVLVTHMSCLSNRGQVLLMTCQLQVG